MRRLLAEAVTLPDEERAELVNELARTISPDYSAGERDSGPQAISRGKAPVVPWEDARKKLFGERR